MNKNCRVIIDRGKSGVQNFDGVAHDETTTHFLVTHATNPVGEWFAKDSHCVYTHLVKTLVKP